MDEQPPRIVVSLPEDPEDPGDAEERVVVRLDDAGSADATGTAEDPKEPLRVRLDGDESDASSRRRFGRAHRAVSAALLAACVAGLAVGVYFVTRPASPPDPSTVALPKLVASASAAHELRGPDTNLVALVGQAHALERVHASASCRTFAGKQLQPLGSPQSMLDETTGLSDQSVRASLENVLNGVSTYLEACESDRSLTQPRDQLVFSTEVATRILAKMGITTQEITL